MNKPIPVRKALIIVDVQNDFCEGGSLAVTGGNDAAKYIADFLGDRAREYRVVCFTRDWHIDPGDHFSDNPDYEDTWPAHCVADTHGAEFHPRIQAIVDRGWGVTVTKGKHEAAYSGFDGSVPWFTANGLETLPLNEFLQQHNVNHVDTCGIATEKCVDATNMGALERGFSVTCYRDLCASLSPETGEETFKKWESAGIEVI